MIFHMNMHLIQVIFLDIKIFNMLLSEKNILFFDRFKLEELMVSIFYHQLNK